MDPRILERLDEQAIQAAAKRIRQLLRPSLKGVRAKEEQEVIHGMIGMLVGEFEDGEEGPWHQGGIGLTVDGWGTLRLRCRGETFEIGRVRTLADETVDRLLVP